MWFRREFLDANSLLPWSQRQCQCSWLSESSVRSLSVCLSCCLSSLSTIFSSDVDGRKLPSLSVSFDCLGAGANLIFFYMASKTIRSFKNLQTMAIESGCHQFLSHQLHISCRNAATDNLRMDKIYCV